jgi:hypothetical protein
MKMGNLGDDGDRVNVEMGQGIHPIAAILLIVMVLWVFGRE